MTRTTVPARRVVVAPDSFKGSVSARQAAEAIASGWLARRPHDIVDLVPMADGGEGTLDALAESIPAAERRPVRVGGPDGRPVATFWLLLPDGTAVVELAGTCGITLLIEPAPLTAHTRGFGQAIRAALDSGVNRLLLAIGGSGSTDGGMGVLRELGAAFTGADGLPVADGGGALNRLAAVDLAALRPIPSGGVTVLSDVTSPLLGPSGAAAVFGPQKGASPGQVRELEAGLTRLAALLPAGPDAAGAGAAGGVGFGLLAWGATLRSGATEIAGTVGLRERIADADLVITGEGRFDAQSQQGKLTGVVADIAAAAGRPIALVAGSIEADTTAFAAAQSLAEISGSTAAALAQPVRWLRAAATTLAAELGHR